MVVNRDELAARIEAVESNYKTCRFATLEWGRYVDTHSRLIDKLWQRVEALEALDAAMQCTHLYVPAKPERQGKLDRLIEQDRSNAQQLTLVERVADAILESPSDPEGWSGEARAAIRAVAAWINECELKAQNDPDCLEASTADDVVGWLHNEASR